LVVVVVVVGGRGVVVGGGGVGVGVVVNLIGRAIHVPGFGGGTAGGLGWK